MPRSTRAKISILSSQAGTGGEMRPLLKALRSVLKVKWCFVRQGLASHGPWHGDGFSRTLETGVFWLLQPRFSSLRVPQTARPAPAGAGGRCRGTMVAVRGQPRHRGQGAHCKWDARDLVDGGALGCVCSCRPRSG